MPNWIAVDDTSDQIAYSGPWSRLTGSTRQWEGGVHSTTHVGASCVLRFKGVGVLLRATIPAGSGDQVFEYRIDNAPAVRVSNPQRSADEYFVQLFRVVDLPEAIHSITLTNVGATPFQVDMIEYWPGDNDPIPAPLYPVAAPQPEEPTSQPQSPQVTPNPGSQSEQPQQETEVQGSPGGVSSSTISQQDQPNQNSNSDADSPPQSVSRSSSRSRDPLTIATTDEDGHVFTKILASFTERVVTTTDADGQVSTATIIEALSEPPSLSLGAIVGIALAAAFAILALVIFLLFCRRRRKSRRNEYLPEQRQHEAQPVMATQPPAASNSSITPFNTEDISSGNITYAAPPVWRKEGSLSPLSTTPPFGSPSNHYRQPSSSLSAAALSTSGSGLSYTGEGVNDPPPAYHDPTRSQSPLSDSCRTGSAGYGLSSSGSEKQCSCRH